MKNNKKEPWYFSRIFIAALTSLWVLIVPIITGIALLIKRMHKKDEIKTQ